eukprot:CAMPEP_0185590088 /NCGR_PEP_ID=MMETSP0434-20130131/59453_1 /TAXON_ID=626734 ORGANISM="Favella taraikaensis, Strain Fe Narragansett Bay" /NCGR_SAMPLE_ID=MMETSP0434 /ASSEMBLY_ACC=CAM_ASM_000379 /LENGTH=86 /DNA_ID=CAMNT_0028213983 /DNA_START=27 /DNA_END=287 /DNA_ORIENTATION=-
MVKAACQSVEEKILEASPKKIRKTGNVVLDKINKQIERQRTVEINANHASEMSIINLPVFTEGRPADETPLRKKGDDDDDENKPTD